VATTRSSRAPSILHLREAVSSALVEVLLEQIASRKVEPATIESLEDLEGAILIRDLDRDDADVLCEVVDPVQQRLLPFIYTTAVDEISDFLREELVCREKSLVRCAETIPRLRDVAMCCFRERELPEEIVVDLVKPELLLRALSPVDRVPEVVALDLRRPGIVPRLKQITDRRDHQRDGRESLLTVDDLLRLTPLRLCKDDRPKEVFIGASGKRTLDVIPQLLDLIPFSHE